MSSNAESGPVQAASHQGQKVLPGDEVRSSNEQRRVALATTVGTAIEWYDFFLYASAAGLVFNKLFFAGLGAQAATVASFLTVGLSFLFRPLGAFLAGYFGDKLGRRVVLMVTLMGMGTATAIIGLLPTYASIGVAAPILLVFLRVLQGISAGGEWGGAVLMAVEHAPDHKRGWYGCSPQVGVPLGLLLASGILALMSVIAPGDAFLDWGWRIPFLISVVLIALGYFIRRGVDESPVFKEIAERKEQTSNPIGALFRRHGLLVLLAALVFAGNNAVGYMTTGGWIQKYASNPDGPVGLSRDTVLLAVTGSAASWLVFTLLSGKVSDLLGRKKTYILGFILQLGGVFTLFPLVNHGDGTSLFFGLALLTIGTGFTYGPQAAMYAEIFPASVRFSGVSISYAIGAILGGAFAPTIAETLVDATGSTQAVTYYLAAMSIIGLLAVVALRDKTNVPLGPLHEEEQRERPFIWSTS
ncbi:MFS transporter [Corynebacterium pelargi]|uniref:Inner membrane metabolite transport protein YhjE n=1 Tax=Corynebacterium pelargi TaxID=1471400 RepID=A0A410WA58_9CORY|nr:Inner membrane metabolite transport protein YhjE [Corynebacterium pelargi]GGG76553.1 MFS transporter [Corynebacterium pelargi]